MARALVLVALALLVAWPALRSPPTDGFPLSTYPMFASDRGRESVVATAVGRTADGERVRLSPELLAATDEPMLAVATARRAVESGRASAWCEEIAARLAADRNPDDIVQVEVVVETHDAVAFFADDAPASAIDRRADCPVPAA